MPILKETRHLPSLEGKWLASLHNSMQQIKCTIKPHDTWMPRKQKEHDWFIIDVLPDSPYVEDTQLDPINWCRLFIQDLLLSDICTSDRKYLAKYFQNKEPPTELTYEPDLEWPQQGRPNHESWTIFTRMLRKVLCREDARLHAPLGKWNKVSSE
eukprot:10174038-Ditylum_brightwellii.AAC.1